MGRLKRPPPSWHVFGKGLTRQVLGFRKTGASIAGGNDRIMSE
ncbi:hypothetical protein AWT69_003684 [Pseudomonas putida]|nr:hypothetical protein AWT69_003684 [Pseudomonas putida]